MSGDRNYWAGRAQGKRQATHTAEREVRELTAVVEAQAEEIERLRREQRDREMRS
jgi:hypothetical protein